MIGIHRMCLDERLVSTIKVEEWGLECTDGQPVHGVMSRLSPEFIRRGPLDNGSDGGVGVHAPIPEVDRVTVAVIRLCGSDLPRRPLQNVLDVDSRQSWIQ